MSTEAPKSKEATQTEDPELVGGIEVPAAGSEVNLHHEFSSLADLASNELRTSVKEAGGALRKAIAPHRVTVAKVMWSRLGADGILALFSAMYPKTLETFLRRERTPMPKRPARPDAQMLLRKGNQGGPNAIGRYLHILGTPIANRAFAFWDEEDREGFDAWRTEYTDAVLSAALCSDLFCSHSSGARAIGTMSWAGLLPEVFESDPAVLERVEDVVRAVDEARAEQGRLREELLDAVAVEELVEAFFATGTDPGTVSEVFGRAASLIDTESEAMASFFDRAGSGELPDVEPIAATRRVLEALEALSEALAPVIAHIGEPNLPAMSTLEGYFALDVGHVEDGSAEQVPGRMEQLSGPDNMEAALREIRAAATADVSEIAPFVHALEELIDMAPDPSGLARKSL